MLDCFLFTSSASTFENIAGRALDKDSRILLYNAVYIDHKFIVNTKQMRAAWRVRQTALNSIRVPPGRSVGNETPLQEVFLFSLFLLNQPGMR